MGARANHPVRDDIDLLEGDWYATEPLVDADKVKALRLAAEGKVPFVRESVTRKMAAGAK